MTNPWANECPVFFDNKPPLVPLMGPNLRADNRGLNELNQRLPYARSAKIAKTMLNEKKTE